MRSGVLVAGAGRLCGRGCVAAFGFWQLAAVDLVVVYFLSSFPGRRVKLWAENEDSLASSSLTASDAGVQVDDPERFAACTVFVLRSSVLFRVVTRMNAYTFRQSEI
jgi:hypothetical protein